MRDTFFDYADSVSDVIGDEIVRMVGNMFPMVMALAPDEFPAFLQTCFAAGVMTAFGMIDPEPPAGQLELPL